MDFLIKDLIKLNDYPTVEKLVFHKELSKIFNKDSILFDTLFYGPSGSGKTTLFFSYLQKIFGKQVIEMVPNINIDSKTSQEIVNFNMEKVGCILTNHNLTLINDSVDDETIQNFLREYIERMGEITNYIVILHLNRLKPKTLSIITNFIDNRKSKTYILATSNRLDHLELRLKSRFESYRIPRPSIEELTEYFYKLIPQKFEFPQSKIQKIIENTNRDIKLSIIYINQRLLESIDPTLKKKSLDNFKYYINCLLQVIIKKDLKNLPVIRSMILTIYQSCLSWNEFLSKFLDLLYNNTNGNSQIIITEEQKIEISQRTADLDHKIKLSKPNYIHYEAFVFMILDVIT
jgi:hypothetical protein